jgi:hypothetical protein
VDSVRVPWSSASFLAYLGGVLILVSLLTLLGVQAEEHGSAGLVFWALVVLVVVTVLAFAALASGHRVTAGLFALSVVAALLVFLGALLEWFGWLAEPDAPLEGFHVSILFLELVAVIAAAVAWAIFRFPLLVFVVAASSWLFITDLISGGGDWSAIVTIAVGLVLLAVALAAGPVPAFWLHVSAGLAIGGGLLWFFHDSTFDWIVIGIAGLAYVALGDRLLRSSWAVLGAWGMLQTASYFAAKWSDLGLFFFIFPFFYLTPFIFSAYDDEGRNVHEWAAPLVFAVTGLVFIAIALVLARRRRDLIPAAELI